MLARQHVVSLLRKTGFTEAAEEASRTLPDPVEVEDVNLFLAPYGITKHTIMSMLGGSP
jgi:hypothetical protein